VHLPSPQRVLSIQAKRIITSTTHLSVLTTNLGYRALGQIYLCQRNIKTCDTFYHYVDNSFTKYRYLKPEPASSLNVDSSSEIPSELAESKAAKRRRDVDISSDGSEPKAAKRRRKSYSRKSDIDGLVWQGLQEELRRRAIFEKQMLDLARQNLKVMRAFQRDFSVFVLRNQSK
jgi:hypothetical protein